MKDTVKEILKESGNPNIFTQELYNKAVATMKEARKADQQLNKFLGITPYYRAKYVADTMMLNSK